MLYIRTPKLISATQPLSARYARLREHCTRGDRKTVWARGFISYKCQGSDSHEVSPACLSKQAPNTDNNKHSNMEGGNLKALHPRQSTTGNWGALRRGTQPCLAKSPSVQYPQWSALRSHRYKQLILQIRQVVFMIKEYIHTLLCNIWKKRGQEFESSETAYGRPGGMTGRWQNIFTF